MKIPLFKRLFGQLTDEEIKIYTKRTSEDLNSFRQTGYMFFKTVCWWYAKIMFNAQIINKHNLPAQWQNMIVVSNHKNNLDPFIVGGITSKVHMSYMAKKELFTDIRTRWFMDVVGCFMVDRAKLDVSTIKTAKAVVKTPGWVLGLFPEGTRNTTGDAETKKGAAFIAKATKANVLPVHIKYDDNNKARIYIGKLIENTGQDIDELATIIENAINSEDTSPKNEDE